MQKPPRPTGVTILAVLEFLVGIVLVLAGLGAIVGSTFIGLFGLGAFSGLFAVFGAIFLVVGILSLVVGWGMWTGREWAWIVGIVLAILGLLTGLAQLAGGSAGSILGIIIDLIILYYLTRPHIRAYFKGQPAPPAPMGPPPSTTP